MAFLLTRAVDGWTKTKHGVYHKGYGVMSADTSQYGAAQTLPNFVEFNIPDATREELAYLLKLWMTEITVEKVSNTEFKLAMKPEWVSKSGENSITENTAKEWMDYWNCSHQSLNGNDQRAGFTVPNLVKSRGFWFGAEDIAAHVIPDVAAAQMQNAQINYKAAKLTVEGAAGTILNRGGSVTANNGTRMDFQVPEEDTIEAARHDIELSCRYPYRRRTHVLNEALIDAAISAGGKLSVSKAELLANSYNRLEN